MASCVFEGLGVTTPKAVFHIADFLVDNLPDYAQHSMRHSPDCYFGSFPDHPTAKAILKVAACGADGGPRQLVQQTSQRPIAFRRPIIVRVGRRSLLVPDRPPPRRRLGQPKGMWPHQPPPLGDNLLR